MTTENYWNDVKNKPQVVRMDFDSPDDDGSKLMQQISELRRENHRLTVGFDLLKDAVITEAQQLRLTEIDHGQGCNHLKIAIEPEVSDGEA